MDKKSVKVFYPFATYGSGVKASMFAVGISSKEMEVEEDCRS